MRPEETSSLRVRHDAYVKNGRVVIGYAERIVEDATAVKVNNEYVRINPIELMKSAFIYPLYS